MPPSINLPPAPDLPADRVAVLPPDVVAISSFFSLEGYGAALVSTNFTRKEHTETIIAIARNTSAKPSERLKALQMLHDMGVELMDLNGILVSIKEQQHATTQDGSVLQTRIAESRTFARLLAHSLQPPAHLTGAIIHTPAPTPLPADEPRQADRTQVADPAVPVQHGAGDPPILREGVPGPDQRVADAPPHPSQ